MQNFIENHLGIRDYEIEYLTRGKDNITTKVTYGNETVIIQEMSEMYKYERAKEVTTLIENFINDGISFSSKVFDDRFIEFEGTWYQVMKYIPGGFVSWKIVCPELIKNLAQFLAKYHNVSEGYENIGTSKSANFKDIDDWIEKCRFYSKRDNSNQDILKRIQDIRKSNHFDSDLRKGYLHGDPVFKNVITGENNDIIGLVDYDKMEYDNLLWDLADNIRGYLKLDFFRKKHFDMILESYEQIRPLTEKEKKNLKSYIALNSLNAACQYFLSLYEGSGLVNHLGGKDASIKNIDNRLKDIEKSNSFFEEDYDENLKVLILAGGSGTRLWPLSRETSPKQFTKLKELGGISLFQQALKRALAVTRLENIYVVTSKGTFFHTNTQSDELGFSISESHIIIQPCMRETLPIIALATKHIGEGNILMMPSDHIIEENYKFKKIVYSGEKQLSENIVVFGVKPTGSDTGYGYIEKEDANTSSKLKHFHEKPTNDKAVEYVSQGFLWNSGIYMYNSEVFWKELGKFKPEMKKLLLSDKSDDEIFDSIESISIDFGLSEKSDNIYCIDFDIYWNDLGTFDAIGDYINIKSFKDSSVITHGKCRNNIVLNEDNSKDIALIDVEDLIVVDHEDVLLISKRGSSQKVKAVMEKSRKMIGLTVYKPWGSYRILEEGDGYKTKNLTLYPGKKISLQKHNHRSEHWVLVRGIARVIIGEEEKDISHGESVYVQCGQMHRLENIGKEPLVVIETQFGEKILEDDITRYDDDFGRIN